jgi:hypothetical protein
MAANAGVFDDYRFVEDASIWRQQLGSRGDGGGGAYVTSTYIRRGPRGTANDQPWGYLARGV